MSPSQRCTTTVEVILRQVDRKITSMARYVILAMMIGSSLVDGLMGQDRTRPVPPIPDTISKESQNFLRTAPPIPDSPQTLDEWANLQAEIEKRETPRSKAVVEALSKSLEIRNMNGVDVHVITPKSLSSTNADKALIHIHGGAFCLYTAKSSYFMCAPLADLTGLKVYSIDYRLAPQHPFPAGLNDCVTAYRQIIKEVAPEKIGAFGISAGGSLILAMTLKARAEGIPVPRALAPITPCTDMGNHGDARATLDGLDPILSAKSMTPVAKAYAGDADLKNPLISPVYARYPSTFPPTLIQTGTRDLFLSDGVRLYCTMKGSGVDVELSIWEGMWHGFHVLPDLSLPEGKAAFEEVADFFDKVLELNLDR